MFPRALNPLVVRLAALACLLLAAPAGAQSPFSVALDGASWGDSMETVLAIHHDRILAEYRTSIAGVRDPIQIDRMRRESDERYRAIADSAETFDGARTGYEVSVIQDEVRVGAGQSMFAVRDEYSINYFVFADDALAKVIVTFDQASLDFLGFEAFVGRLEAALGGPESTDWRVDDIGVRHMTRAVWSDGTTRVRAEDKSRMFASYLVVYTDASRDEAPVAEGTRPHQVVNRPEGTRDIGSLIRRMDGESTGARDNSAAVDQILGAPTEVELRLRSDAEVLADREAEAAAQGSALDEDEELEDVDQVERPRRSSTPDERPEETETDEGGIIY